MAIPTFTEFLNEAAEFKAYDETNIYNNKQVVDQIIEWLGTDDLIYFGEGNPKVDKLYEALTDGAKMVEGTVMNTKANKGARVELWKKGDIEFGFVKLKRMLGEKSITYYAKKSDMKKLQKINI